MSRLEPTSALSRRKGCQSSDSGAAPPRCTGVISMPDLLMNRRYIPPHNGGKIWSGAWSFGGRRSGNRHQGSQKLEQPVRSGQPHRWGDRWSDRPSVSGSRGRRPRLDYLRPAARRVHGHQDEVARGRQRRVRHRAVCDDDLGACRVDRQPARRLRALAGGGASTIQDKWAHVHRAACARRGGRARSSRAGRRAALCGR